MSKIIVKKDNDDVDHILQKILSLYSNEFVMMKLKELKARWFNLVKGVKEWALMRKKPLLILLSVVLLLLFSYMLNNQTLLGGENKLIYTWVEYFKGLFRHDHSDEEDVVYINVGYDKQLVDLTDSFGFSIGNAPITDRSKLLRLLQMLNQQNTSRFIFLDLSFEKDFKTDVDSLLFKEIRKSKRIVTASHPDVELADSSLVPVAAWNNYSTTIFAGGFDRYEYSYQGKPSMPLFAYHQLTGNTITRHWPFYLSNGRLCYNCLFIRFPVEKSDEYGEDNVKYYYNLGSDILDHYSAEDLGVLCKDKYVVIGDMNADLHSTYSGIKSGPLVTYFAFRELMEGKHFVSFNLVLLLFLLYLGISWSQLYRWDLLDKLAWFKSPSKPRLFVKSLIGYGILFLICSFLLALIFNVFISFMLPSLYFSIQKTVIEYKRMKI